MGRRNIFISPVLMCMIEWSLSRHCRVCINYFAENSKGWLNNSFHIDMRLVGPVVECRIRHRDLGQVPVWIPCQCVSSLCKALHATLLLLTHEKMATCEDRSVSRSYKLRVSGCFLPLRLISRWIYRDWKVPITWKDTCQVCGSELWAWMWTQNSDFILPSFCWQRTKC